MIADSDIENSIYRLARKRGAAKSICPSEVARDLEDDWRPLMRRVRDSAFKLAESGVVVVTQQGRRVGRGVSGPVRISITEQS